MAKRLVVQWIDQGHEVFGIDRRPWADAPCEVLQADARSRAAEEALERWRPEVVIQMEAAPFPFVEAGHHPGTLAEGTRALFARARAQEARHCVYWGHHVYYGAGFAQPLFHVEDEPAGELHSFTSLADLVAADVCATTALWRHPEVATTVIRQCYTLGPSARGTLASYLRQRTIPVVLGFDPLFQILHEDDAIAAAHLVVARRPRGVFNLGGPPPLPLSEVIREAGRTPTWIPGFALAFASGRLGLPGLADGAFPHLKYPVVVDSRAFREATGFNHARDAIDAIHDFRKAIATGMARDARS
jgi:UDP-glucose 4-epimerase